MSESVLIIEVKKGADYSIALEYQDSDGVPVSLTGYTFTSSVKRTPTDTATLAIPTITVLDQDDFPGQYTFNMTKAQIEALPVDQATDYLRKAKMYPFQINMVTPLSVPEVPVYGYLKVIP
jgi:hypothetical protein